MRLVNTHTQSPALQRDKAECFMIREPTCLAVISALTLTKSRFSKSSRSSSSLALKACTCLACDLSAPDLLSLLLTNVFHIAWPVMFARLWTSGLITFLVKNVSPVNQLYYISLQQSKAKLSLLCKTKLKLIYILMYMCIWWCLSYIGLCSANAISVWKHHINDYIFNAERDILSRVQVVAPTLRKLHPIPWPAKTATLYEEAEGGL